MDWIDAHTHLDAPAFDDDRPEVVARARAAGVGSFVLCGADPEGWDRTAGIAREVGGWACFGVHPWWAATLGADALDPWLAELRRRPMIALGEIGLDPLRARDPEARENQRRALREQLAVARERDLPVVLHCVRAYPELLAVLERDGLPRRGGMLHAWSGPPDQVDRAVALGLHLSFGPLVSNPGARKARQSAVIVPPDRLLVETDCPDGRPVGTARGEPAHLVRVIDALAALRGEEPRRLGDVAAANTRRLLGLG